MKKIAELVRAITLTYLMFGSSLAVADIIIPTLPGEKYDPEVLLPALEDEIKSGAFLTALEIIWSATGELSEDIVSGDVLYFIGDWLSRPGNAEWLAKKAYDKWGGELKVFLRTRLLLMTKRLLN